MLNCQEPQVCLLDQARQTLTIPTMSWGLPQAAQTMVSLVQFLLQNFPSTIKRANIIRFQGRGCLPADFITFELITQPSDWLPKFTNPSDDFTAKIGPFFLSRFFTVAKLTIAF